MTEQPAVEYKLPALEQPYSSALQEAVEYILSRFNVHGIIASGSILRGNPHAGSDLDICVINVEPVRQRIQRIFQGVPAEIFVNPPQMIRTYFELERRAGRPLTAHMYTTGFVVLNRDPAVDLLRKEAAAWLQKRPDLSETELTTRRYFNADAFENAEDIIQTDPANASLLMHEAIIHMIHYRFLAANQNLPRHKEMIGGLSALDPAAGTLVREFFTAGDLSQKLLLGRQIAELLNGARAFFEWESEQEVIRQESQRKTPCKKANITTNNDND
jgi:predicted nucleotidyltransferase